MNQKHIKTIVHVTCVHGPRDIRIFHKECRFLVEAGYRVFYVAPFRGEAHVDGGVHIVPVSPRSNRLLRLMFGGSDACRRALALHADLYHLHDPELLPWANLMLKGSGRPIVYDCHEHLDLNMISKTWIPKPLRPILGGPAAKIEQVFARRLAGVVVVNRTMKARFANQKQPVVLAGNCPIVELFEVPSAHTAEQEAIIYAGWMGKKSGYETIVKSMEILKAQHSEAFVDIFGRMLWKDVSPSIKFSTEELARRGIRFRQPQPYEKIAQRLSRYRVGWCPLYDTPQNRVGIPTKVFDYAAAALPVVVSDLPVMAKFVRDNDCGLVAKHDSPPAHAEAIHQLLDDPDAAARMGANGRKAIEREYNWSSQMRSLLGLYDQLLSLNSHLRHADNSHDL